MQLLEKKKNQQILDTTENIECLCNLLKTVGKKLDVEKAQVCTCICISVQHTNAFYKLFVL